MPKLYRVDENNGWVTKVPCSTFRYHPTVSGILFLKDFLHWSERVDSVNSTRVILSWMFLNACNMMPVLFQFTSGVFA